VILALHENENRLQRCIDRGFAKKKEKSIRRTANDSYQMRPTQRIPPDLVQRQQTLGGRKKPQRRASPFRQEIRSQTEFINAPYVCFDLLRTKGACCWTSARLENRTSTRRPYNSKRRHVS
jgi:hypothetical protein